MKELGRSIGWTSMSQAQSQFNCRGFTLFEMVAVIAVTAIMAAIALPRYSEAVNRQKVDAAARRIVADLAMAQTRAKANSSSQAINFTAGTSQYQIPGMSDLDHAAVAYSVNLAADPYAVTLTWSGIGADNALSFNGYGVPDSSGTFVVSRGNYSKTVTLDSDTGATKVQ